jgi:adenylate cyclase
MVLSVSRFSIGTSTEQDRRRDTLKQIEERNTVLDEKTRMLESLSVKLSKHLSPQVYASIFAGSRDVELATPPTCSRKT